MCKYNVLLMEWELSVLEFANFIRKTESTSEASGSVLSNKVCNAVNHKLTSTPVTTKKIGEIKI